MQKTTQHKDMTIFAPATVWGRAPIQIIRISGNSACEVLIRLCQPNAIEPRKATPVVLRDNEGEMLDHAMVLFFPSPHSATGEDVVELHLHGSPALGRRVIETLQTLPDFRLAEAGEFTRRGFLHGRLSLEQAEAIGDIIDADTAAQHKAAIGQLAGGLGQMTEGWRNKIIAISAQVEAVLDFADEDLPPTLEQSIMQLLSMLSDSMAQAITQARQGIITRDGVRVVILGPPNAGKSTLLNRLARDARAIVSADAGTTRDLIEVSIDIGGMAVHVTDTAGIHEAQNAIEQEGIRRALGAAAKAQILVLLIEAARLPPSTQLNQKAWTPQNQSTLNGVAADIMATLPQEVRLPRAVRLPRDSGESEAPMIIKVLSKADTLESPATIKNNSATDGLPLSGYLTGNSATDGLLTGNSATGGWMAISAKTGFGMAEFEAALAAAIKGFAPQGEAAVLTRTRHLEAVKTAYQALVRAQNHSIATAPELLAEELRLAATALGRITGRIDAEAVLDSIFASFCIGK